MFDIKEGGITVAHVGMRGNKGMKRNYIGKNNVEF
jgi:hypothetical protein